jgi:hypothetical protein
LANEGKPAEGSANVLNVFYERAKWYMTLLQELNAGPLKVVRDEIPHKITRDDVPPV